MWSKHLTVTLLLIVVISGISIIVTKTILQKQYSESSAILQNALNENNEKLLSIADALDKGKLDDRTSEVIRDCDQQKQDRFDVLLNGLSLLKDEELQEALILLDSCARALPSKIALMVVRLDEHISTRDTLARALPGYSYEQSQVSLWTQLSEVEGERSQLINRQVAIQSQIIQLLLNGVMVTDDAMQSLTKEAREIAESAEVLGKRSDSIRATLMTPQDD